MLRLWIAGLVGLLGLSACEAIDHDGVVRIKGDFDAVRVLLSNGDLTVREIPGDAARVEARFGGVARPGAVDRRVQDGVLVIDYACAMCGGSVEVAVPAGMPVQARLRRGDLSLLGLSGPVQAQVNAGAIHGEDLACDVDLLARAGEIELDWSFRPHNVRAVAHLGAVDLGVPAGGYDLQLSAGLGAVRLVDVFDDPQADATLTASAAMGEVAIRGH